MLLLAAAALPSTGEAQDPAIRPESVRAAVEAYRAASEAAVMEELRALLGEPNLATDLPAIRRNAELLVSMLERRGIEARLLELADKPPAVFGELRAPGAQRTVVLYAHYDGQPVDSAEWANPPWEPTLRSGRLEDGAGVISWADAAFPLADDWRIYARSASDDKSPIVAFLAALDALRAAGLPQSVNLKFFLEGEEEAGSPNLAAILQTHRDLLAADAWIFLDGPIHQSGQMQVVFGVRGVLGLQLTVYGASRALHSGHYGNWAPNPAMQLTHLLASMRDPAGRVTIDGFYDAVRPPTPAERAAIATLPPIENELVHELALGAPEGDGERLLERTMLPALNLDGVAAGGVGAAARNAIPATATGALDVRLVPDQDPARIRALIEQHIREAGYFVVHDDPSPEQRRQHAPVVRVQWEDGYAAVRTPLELAAARAIVETVERVLERPVLQVPMLGGSLPLAFFAQAFGAPLVIVPMVNHDNNQHAANENLRIANFWDGVRTYAGLIALLGPAWNAAEAVDR